MSTLPLPRNMNRLWLVGGITFLITALFPLLVGALLLATELGVWTINGLIVCCVQPGTLGEVIALLAILLTLPIGLSLLVVFLWRRRIRSGRPLRTRDGLLLFLQADLLVGLAGFLLATLFVLLPALLLFNSEALGFFWLMLCIVIVSQTVSSLPFLLLAGALIARFQSRVSTLAE
jgi:hypothetical protein